MAQQDAKVVTKVPGPRILPFVNRRQKNFAECVADEFRSVAPFADGVVILYKDATGKFRTLTDQGDIAGMLLFLERAKAAVIQEETPELLTS